MPAPDYEELYEVWVKRLAQDRADQYTKEYPDPRPWCRPTTRLQALLLALAMVASCGLLWAACRLVTGG